MATISGIYCIKHIVSGKCYVGQAVDVKRRWAAHKRCNGKGAHAIGNAIKAHGVDAFEFAVIEECRREDLNAREIAWIERLNCMSPYGYNLNSGGNAATTVSVETRQRQAAAQRGKVHPREVVEKRRQAVIGQKRSEETKAKQSAAMIGKKLSPEHREKCRLGRLGKPAPNKGRPMSQSAKEKMIAAKVGVPATWRYRSVVRHDGVVFESIKAAALAIGATYRGIIRVLNGDRQKIYGWSFSYGG